MAKMKTHNFIAALCVCGIIFFAGCEEKQKIKTETGKKKISQQKAPQDNNSVSKLKAENKKLTEQIETLIGLGKPARIKALSTLTSIDLTSRSGLYAKSNNKKKDTLIVYLRPIDDMGDVVKVAGIADVQLWNLNLKPENALLKEWKIEPEDLKKKWSGSLLTSYYKLQFDVNSVLTGKEKELTLKTQFTDYLTGKVLKSQRVIKDK